ncbi:MAG TPA: RNA polymerase subunit sigma-24 [Desulfosporosinus sp.]|nr:RNA polymerase subunit sigma-24 [Desulfosporosinus sp.]
MSDYKNVLVEKAINGDKQALNELIVGIKDKIYNLSLRMLWNPADAEDVTQEILIKLITNLAKFRSESKFSTWVYRIASNHLINTNKRGLENQQLSFEIYEKSIRDGFDIKEQVLISEAERTILAEELKVSCTHAMLLCLDREHRMIYILSSMFGINSFEGASIMDITPETYRKRLSRTRQKMRSFMENNCGLVNPDKMCRCNRRVEVAIENQRINPEQLIFTNRPLADTDLVGACKEEMEEFDRVSAVFTSNPYYLTPENVLQGIKKLMTSDNYKILEV